MTTGESITLKLAEYAAGLRWQDLPADVKTKVKQHLRDSLGNQLAATVLGEPSAVMVSLLREWGGKPEATVVGYGVRAPAPHVAMANAMMGHGVELDDAHDKGLIKAGCVLVPTAVAMGESLRAPGADVLAALVAGYEVAVRIAVAMNPEHRQRGYQTTGTVGTVGAAVVAGRLLGLSGDQVAQAMGLAVLQAAGIQCYLDEHTMAKPLSPARAAFSGVLAAVLVGKGMTGPRIALESKEGLFRGMAGKDAPADLADDLGERYALLEVGFKPHSACRYAHGPIDAAQELYRRYRLDPSSIRGVRVLMSELAIRQSGHSEVPTVGAAMGSTPFSVALALAYGANGLAEYREGHRDRRVLDLTSRIRVERYPEAGVMGRATVVEVETSDGQFLTQSEAVPRGEPERPLSESELLDKFNSMASLALSPEECRTLAEALGRAEEVQDVGQLVALTTTPKAGAASASM